MKLLCDEFDIPLEDIDLLIASVLLHDIGLNLITIKGKVEIDGWKYYENTGYSRNETLWRLHPNISAQYILDNCDIPRKIEIANLVSIHMSKQFQHCKQPYNLYEYLVCLVDYISSRKEITYDYK